MIIRAGTHIKAGDEMVTHYISRAAPFEERKMTLNRSFGFECDCHLCSVESKMPAALLRERERLKEDADLFLFTWNAAYPGAPKFPNRGVFYPTLSSAKKLQTDIEATYTHNKGVYDQLSCIACLGSVCRQ